MEDDIDYCPATYTHQHAWYQTVLCNYLDGMQAEKVVSDTHVSASHACKCGQWRITHYPRK